MKLILAMCLLGCGSSAPLGNPDAPIDAAPLPCTASGVRLCLDFEDLAAGATTTADLGPTGNAAQLTDVIGAPRTARSQSAKLAADSSISIDDPTGYDITGDMTMMAWVDLPQAPAAGGAWIFDNDSQYGLEITPDPIVYCVWVTSAAIVRVMTTAPYPTGGWHHIACTRAGSATAIYIDGAMAAMGTGDAGALSTKNTAPLQIGADANPGAAPSHRLIGGLDDAELFDRALSADELAAYVAANK